MCCCTACSSHLTSCPLCRRRIDQVVKTYRHWANSTQDSEAFSTRVWSVNTAKIKTLQFSVRNPLLFDFKNSTFKLYENIRCLLDPRNSKFVFNYSCRCQLHQAFTRFSSSCLNLPCFYLDYICLLPQNKLAVFLTKTERSKQRMSQLQQSVWLSTKKIIMCDKTLIYFHLICYA